MTRLTLSFLGSPKIQLDEVEVNIGRAKALALLAYLAVTQRPAARDSLLPLFWPDYDAKQASAYLRQTLWTLNKALGKNWITATTDTIELDFGNDLSVDVIEYQRHIRISEFEPGAAARQAEMLHAVKLYRGEFLAGFGLGDSPDFEQWQLLEAQSLHQTHAALLAKLVESLTEQQNYSQAIEFAVRWLALDALNEAAHRQLMKLYAWSGQAGMAVRQFQECTQLLNKELGVRPAEATIQLYSSITQNRLPPPSLNGHSVNPLVAPPPHKAAIDTSQPLSPPKIEQAPLTRQLPTTSSTLPPSVTPFIGRQVELEQITALIIQPHSRLVTLIGSGGIGKTRLAIAVGEAHQKSFADGVFFVSLVDVSPADRLVTAIANALEFTLYRREEEPLQQLLTYLSNKQLLLILDNFEHLLDAASLVGTILNRTTGVKVLATSRERLNVEGEWLVEVPGLAYPRPNQPLGANEPLLIDYSAVELFVRSAQRVNASFALDAQNQPAVVKICQLVEGMPLALELAATWMRLLSCEEIVSEIQQGIAILSTTQRNIPERHRSMVALFNYSWSLLNDIERKVVEQLAVFCGGFRRDAAQSIAGATLPILLSLSDKSLLRREGNGRFGMHELLRQFAAEKLSIDNPVAATVHDRHAAYFMETLNSYAARLYGKQQKQILSEILADLENIREGWKWVVQHQQLNWIDAVLEPLATVFELYGWFHEGEKIFAEAVTQCQHRQNGLAPNHRILQVEGKLMARLAFFSHRLGKYEQAKGQFLRSIELLAAEHAESEMIYCLNNLGDIARVEGNYEQAQRYLEQSIHLCKTHGVTLLQGRALNILGIVCGTKGEYDLAKGHFNESLQICEAIEDQLGIAKALNNLGLLAYFAQDYTSAIYFCQRSLTINQDLGHHYDAALALSNLGMAAQKQKDYSKAIQMLRESSAILQQIGYELGVGLTLVSLSAALLEQGKSEEAGKHYLEVLHLGRKIRSTPLMLAGLAGVAALYASKGQVDEAVTLATLVQTHPACDDESRTKANEILQQVHTQNPTLQPAILPDKSLDETLNHLVSALLTTGISPTLLSSFALPLPPRFANVLTQAKGK
ncbi:MAG: tetratricopeptide repeat protein [Caldilineaceae bacterium]